MTGVYTEIRRLILTANHPLAKTILKITTNILLMSILMFVLYQNQQVIPVLFRIETMQNMAISIILYFASIVIQAMIWIDMIGYKHYSRRQGLDDFVQTYLMGRLPGGWWKWIGRITVYRASHLSLSSAIQVSLTEFLLLISSGVALAIAVSATHWAIAVTVVVLYAILLWRLLITLASTKPEFQHWHLFSRVFRWCIGYIIAWILGACILFILILSLQVNPLPFLQIMQISLISGIVGQLLQLLPISALVRDLTLSTLLYQFLSIPQIVVIVFMFRLVYGLGDILSSSFISLAISRPRANPG